MQQLPQVQKYKTNVRKHESYSEIHEKLIRTEINNLPNIVDAQRVGDFFDMCEIDVCAFAIRQFT